MKKIVMITGVFTMLLCMCGCSLKNTEQNLPVAIEITAPSEMGDSIAYGRHFKVAGSFDGEIPQDAEVTVKLNDEDGNTVRYASSSQKGIENVSLDWYEGPVYWLSGDTEFEDIAYTAPELIALKDDESSASDATVKCVYTDETFYALITSATDVQNGLAEDDAFNFTDHEGKAYTALEKGRYTVVAEIKASDGKLLGTASKEIEIGSSEGAVILRGGNNEARKMMEEYALEKNYTVLGDLLPGMYGPYYQLTTMAMSYSAEKAEYLSGKIAVMLYNITETSTSYGCELASFVQKEGTTDNPDAVEYYAIDIGEPAVDKSEGKIIQIPAKEKIHLYRVDSVEDGAEDGIYDLSEKYLIETDTDTDDGCVMNADTDFAITGVTIPYQLKDNELVPAEMYGFYEYLNGVDCLEYTFRSGKDLFSVQKKVGLSRVTETDADTSNPSVYEFYHVFDSEKFIEGREYAVEIKGFDRDGKAIPDMNTELILQF